LALAEKSFAESAGKAHGIALNSMKNERENSGSLMKYRRIILKDGRYMIFYTFDESLSNISVIEEKSEPKQRLEAAEEKNV
jgi:hypothetical protein